MGGCCSKDLDDKRSWSPEETKNGVRPTPKIIYTLSYHIISYHIVFINYNPPFQSTTSTIIAQPLDEVGTTGVFTLTRTTTSTTRQEKTVTTTNDEQVD